VYIDPIFERVAAEQRHVKHQMMGSFELHLAKSIS